jgi:K+-transporting ATPase ATPase C chain
LASGASNLGPLNPALLDAVKANAKALHDAEPDKPIPVDLVTASGSGLDPEISIAAAQYQVARVARARHLAVAQVEALIDAHQEGRLLGFIGERRVNVLSLNLALDRGN